MRSLTKEECISQKWNKYWQAIPQDKHTLDAIFEAMELYKKGAKKNNAVRHANIRK